MAQEHPGWGRIQGDSQPREMKPHSRRVTVPGQGVTVPGWEATAHYSNERSPEQPGEPFPSSVLEAAGAESLSATPWVLNPGTSSKSFSPFSSAHTIVLRVAGQPLPRQGSTGSPLTPSPPSAYGGLWLEKARGCRAPCRGPSFPQDIAHMPYVTRELTQRACQK